MFDIMLIDDDAEWREILALALEAKKDYRIVAEASNGKEAVLLFDYYKPDIVVLDVAMPEYDGIQVLRKIAWDESLTPYIYVITGLTSTAIIEMLEKIQVDRYDIKPIDVMDVVDNLNTLVHTPKRPKMLLNDGQMIVDSDPPVADLNKFIDEFLLQLGVPIHLSGFLCLKTAVHLALDDPFFLTSVTRNVYPRVGEICKLSDKQVERNIRTAIAACKTSNSATFLNLFIHYTMDKVTNTIFLTIVTRHIQYALSRGGRHGQLFPNLIT